MQKGRSSHLPSQRQEFLTFRIPRQKPLDKQGLVQSIVAFFSVSDNSHTDSHRPRVSLNQVLQPLKIMFGLETVHKNVKIFFWDFQSHVTSEILYGEKMCTGCPNAHPLHKTTTSFMNSPYSYFLLSWRGNFEFYS